MTVFKTLFLAAIIFTLTSKAYGLSRIVGGVETTIEKRPYQASLQYIIAGLTPIHNCGGSIISPKYILTAAHCNPGSLISSYYARVGSNNYKTGGQLIKVTKYLSHPDYQSATLDYDFAILTLESEIVIGPYTAVIKLVDGNDPADDSLVTVSGWGVERESNSNLPDLLREADLPVVNQNICRSTYQFLTARQICLGGTPQGMLSACFGDSGGPCVKDGIQYATVSGGNSCERPNVPGIYGRVSTVRDWIRQNTGV